MCGGVESCTRFKSQPLYTPRSVHSVGILVMEVAPEIPQSVFNTQSLALLRFIYGKDATQCVYQHQIDAVKAVSEQLRTPGASNIALVVLPTGCGKTGVAVLAAYALNASKVLVVTPSVKISVQVYEDFCGRYNVKKQKDKDCFLVQRKVIKPEQSSAVCPPGAFITNSSKIQQHLGYPLMVVNAHKIGGLSSVRIEDIPRDSYDLVIVDEAHHYPAPTWKTLVDHFENSRRLFLTATPEYQRKPILAHKPCYEMRRDDAVKGGIIRNIGFHEVKNGGKEPVVEVYTIQGARQLILQQISPSVCMFMCVFVHTRSQGDAKGAFALPPPPAPFSQKIWLSGQQSSY